MRVLYFLILIISIVSCNSVSENDIGKLNGYWEIEMAILPDGTKKEYTINSTIDYFEVKGISGFRKKVMPQLDGKYLVNDQAETFIFTNKDDKPVLNYKTKYATWQEEILKLSKDELVVKNTHGIEYHYKKPEPFSVK